MKKKRCLESLGLEKEVLSPREHVLIKSIQSRESQLQSKVRELQQSKDALTSLKSHSAKYADLLKEISSPVLRQVLASDLKNGKREAPGKR